MNINIFVCKVGPTEYLGLKEEIYMKIKIKDAIINDYKSLSDKKFFLYLIMLRVYPRI